MSKFQNKYITPILFISVVFLTTFTLRAADFENKTVDFQVMLRVFIYAVTVIFLSPNLIKKISTIFSQQTALCLFFFYSTIYGIVFLNFYSLYAILTHISILFIVHVCWVRLGYRLYGYYYFAIILICLVSLFLYYLFPDISRFNYWEDGSYIQSTRMSGSVGHPNALGFLLATGLLTYLGLDIWKSKSFLVRYSFIVLIFGLWLTNSKTSIFTIIVCASFLYCAKKSLIKTYLVSLLILFITILLLVSFFPHALKILIFSASRSGDFEEIFTMTGRTNIWNVVVDLIKNNIIFGYGFASSSQVISSYASLVGFNVSHAHSLYLNLLLTSGLIGVVLSAWFFVVNMRFFLRNNLYFEFSSILMILIVGLTEAIIFGSIATLAFVFLMITVSRRIPGRDIFTKNRI